MSEPAKDHGPEYRHVDDVPWETLRFPGQESKMLFHPRPERSSEPNTGFVRYEPGAYHPRHRHDFAQVWHILEGSFQIGERTGSTAPSSSMRTRTTKKTCPRKRAG